MIGDTAHSSVKCNTPSHVWSGEKRGGGVNLFPIIIYSVETDTSIRLYTTYIVSLLVGGQPSHSIT